MMKKVFLTACAVAFAAISLDAQTTIKPRVELGLNLGSFDVKIPDYDYKLAAGFRVSGAAEISLSESLSTNIYLAPGLTYKNHGTYQETLLSSNRISMHSLSVPVNLGLRANLGNAWGVSFELGPYFSYLLSSKYKESSNTDLFKRFDAGLNASAALEYDRYYFRLGAEYGLTDLRKEKIGDDYVRNMGIFTTVGVRF